MSHDPVDDSIVPKDLMVGNAIFYTTRAGARVYALRLADGIRIVLN